MGQKKNWSTEEKDYLAEHYGEVSMKALAKRMGRSVNGIKIMRTRLGLGRFLENGDYVSLNQLHVAIYGRALNNYIIDTWERNGLPIRRQKVENVKFRVVGLADFWQWAAQHKGLMNFKNFERHALGFEPDWVDIKRQHDFYKREHNDPWTKQEDRRLEDMLGKNTYMEITAAINRSNAAVRRRIYDLGLQGSPLRAKNKAWNEVDKVRLLKFYETGMSLDAIGAKLGRTGGAVRGMYERMRNPNYMTDYRRKMRRNEHCGEEKAAWTPAGRHGYGRAAQEEG